MKRTKRFGIDRNGTLLFLIGLFAQTQIRITGFIAIAELAMVVCAPFVFVKNKNVFMRDRVAPSIVLVLLWALGAVISDFFARSDMYDAIRGLASPGVVVCSIVCLYPLLKRNPVDLRWFLLGHALSLVLSTFMFQMGSDIAVAEKSGQSAVEATMGYKLYWVSLVSAFLSIPIAGWYLQTPFVYSMVASCFIAVFSLITGGRSMFAVQAVSIVLLCIARKNAKGMQQIKRQIPIIMIAMFVTAIAVKWIYSYAATHDWMGETERAKYEKQTEGRSNLLNIIMVGRSEFFIGLIAALDKPILGHGSHALDTKGYRAEFVSKYGSEGDQTLFMIQKQRRKKAGRSYFNIPAHSHIVNFWMWHGVFGLVFWVYFLLLLIQTLRKRMGIFPPYYGYLALTLPSTIWDVLFSPFGSRITIVMTLCVMLLLREMERRKRKVTFQEMFPEAGPPPGGIPWQQ